MIKSVEAVAEVPVAAEDVAASQGSRRFTVDELAWQQLAPDLSDDMIALLATPVVVRASRFAVLDRKFDNQISGVARSALDKLPGLNRTAAPTRAGASRRPGRHRRA